MNFSRQRVFVPWWSRRLINLHFAVKMCYKLQSCFRCMKMFMNVRDVCGIVSYFNCLFVMSRELVESNELTFFVIGLFFFGFLGGWGGTKLPYFRFVKDPASRNFYLQKRNVYRRNAEITVLLCRKTLLHISLWTSRIDMMGWAWGIIYFGFRVITNHHVSFIKCILRISMFAPYDN